MLIFYSPIRGGEDDKEEEIQISKEEDDILNNKTSKYTPPGIMEKLILNSKIMKDGMDPFIIEIKKLDKQLFCHKWVYGAHIGGRRKTSASGIVV